MKVYLVQHGKAVPKERDPLRPMSLKGKAETEKTAAFFKSKNIKVNTIWHSAKLRGIHTAEILCTAVDCSEIQPRNDMNPLDAVDSFPEEILSLNIDLMIVGHLPHLQKLADLMLTGSKDAHIISFKNSGIVCLEYTGSWEISWMVTPSLF